MSKPSANIIEFRPKSGGYVVSEQCMKHIIRLMAGRLTDLELADGAILEKNHTGYKTEVGYSLRMGDHTLTLKPYLREDDVIGGIVLAVAECHPLDHEDATLRGHTKGLPYSIRQGGDDNERVLPGFENRFAIS